MNERLVFILVILGFFMIIIGIIFSLIDFYNDYECSVTTDYKYWKSHNCIRYCKECKDENN